MSQHISHSSYAGPIYCSPARFANLVKRVVRNVRKLKRKLPFEAIAFSGTSGAALAYPLSVALKIPVICVRKPNERSHGQDVEGPVMQLGRYLIVDDFVSTGKTVRHVAKRLRGATLVGVAVYVCKDSMRYAEFGHLKEKIINV